MDFLAVTILNWTEDKYTKTSGPQRWFRQNVSILIDERFTRCTSAHIGVWTALVACAAKAGDGKILIDMKMAVSAARTTRKFLIECCELFESEKLIKFDVVAVEKASQRKRKVGHVVPTTLENPKIRESTEPNNAELTTGFAENASAIDSNSNANGSQTESHFKDDSERFQDVDKTNQTSTDSSTEAPTDGRTDGRNYKSVTIVGPVDSVDNSQSDISKLARAVGGGHVSPREHSEIIKQFALDVTAKLFKALHDKLGDEAAMAFVGDLGREVVKGRYGSFSAFRTAFIASYRKGSGTQFESQLERWTIAFLNKLTSGQKENPQTFNGQGVHC